MSDEYQIVDKGYGKSWVKMLHIKREGQKHTIREYEVDTRLTLATEEDYTKGDNTDIVATDSQKNTVYILAKNHGVGSPEQFALLLVKHFINTYHWVVKAQVHIEAHPWTRIVDGATKKEHNHAFISSPTCIRTATVTQEGRYGQPIVSVGLKGLRVLKTTQSAFTNFVSDEYRCLPDAEDRIFSTIVECNWSYKSINSLNFCQAFNEVKSAILNNFAGPPDTGVFSASVQQTIYLTQVEALKRVPQIDKMTIAMPNRHYFGVNLSKFPQVGSKTNNEVFLPVDKPSGMITATLARKQFGSKL